MGMCLAVLACLSTAGITEAHVEMRQDVPVLMVDGEIITPHAYMTYAPNAKHFAQMGEAGVQIISFSATPASAEPYGNLCPPAWNEEGSFDYAAFDARVNMILDAAPEALLIPRLFLGTPPWWADAHPDDLARWDAPEGDNLVLIRRKPVASFASPAWRGDMGDALRRFIAHVQESSYAAQILGYHIASGMTEEWMQWHGDEPGQWGDYSPVNAARFRTWLKKRYQNDTALQAAWHDDTVTLTTATIPSQALRAKGERGWLRDPVEAQSAIDYTRYNSWMVADTIQHFAAITREATEGKRLVGTFYGYVMQLLSAHSEQTAGHLALREILDSPDIDFIASPTSYSLRELGTGYPHAMAPTASIAHHGKLWFDENDHRTHLAKNAPENFPGLTRNTEETLADMRREFGWTMAQRLGMWWFDMNGGWYDSPEIVDAIGHMRQRAKEHLDSPGASAAEIALVVHPASSAYYRSVPDNPVSWHALNLQQRLLSRIGAPFDVVLLSDLDTLKPYKLYFFAPCPALSEDERALVTATLRRHQAAALWIGVSGLYRDGEMEVAAMEALRGLPVRLETGNRPWKLRPTVAAEPWGWKNAETFATGRGREVIPLPAGGHGTVLAVFEEDNAPGLVAYTHEERLTVYSSIPLLPTALLRAIAENAGVHCYTDTPDIIWASEGLLAISVNEGGPRQISLPQAKDVVDVWTGKTIAENTQDFEIPIRKHDTILLRLR